MQTQRVTESKEVTHAAGSVLATRGSRGFVLGLEGFSGGLRGDDAKGQKVINMKRYRRIEQQSAARMVLHRDAHRDRINDKYDSLRQSSSSIASSLGWQHKGSPSEERAAVNKSVGSKAAADEEYSLNSPKKPGQRIGGMLASQTAGLNTVKLLQ